MVHHGNGYEVEGERDEDGGVESGGRRARDEEAETEALGDPGR